MVYDYIRYNVQVLQNLGEIVLPTYQLNNFKNRSDTIKTQLILTKN